MEEEVSNGLGHRMPLSQELVNIKDQLGVVMKEVYLQDLHGAGMRAGRRSRTSSRISLPFQGGSKDLNICNDLKDPGQQEI